IREPENPFFIDYVRYILLNEEEALGATLEDRQRSLFRGGLTVKTTLDVRLADIADEAIREVLEEIDGPQSALTAVDPKTGEILAIGFGPRAYGKGPGESQVNPAVPYLGDIFGQQTGSSFKAFEIVAALESGVSPAYTTDTPSPYRPTGFCPKNWTPGNYSDGGGGFMDMTRATTFSSNVYFAHLMDEFTGPEKLAEVAERMGVVNTAWEPLAKFNCSNVLGAAGSYPVDMAAGFGTMANNGAHCETHAILEIRDREDRVIARHDPKCKQVIEAGIAARATDLLRGPIDSGTAARNGKIGRPAAGKTGTTQDYHDAWFIGFIPQLSAATWVGHVEGDIEMRDPRCGRSGAVTGGCLPTMIWQRFMTRSIELLELPVEEFPTPPPIPRSTVPAVVGLPIEEAEDIVGEADFVPEAETLPHWAPAGIVFEQNPEAGTSIGGGSKVLLSVSDGTAEPPVVPNLIGMKEPEAVALLDELGYVPKVTLWPVSKPAEYGIVIDQDPVAGTKPELDLYTDPAGLVLGPVEIFVGRPRTADDPPETATARTPGASATTPAKTGNRD
ncbi:MAG TPA: penicillin-binding transpeptidase domain-containing protein, partial [Egibacteraceae bacterium]|nr:penicillin-binding transpeptidase domain-containing protein [Egibacteraceae bacterium]